MQDNSPTLIDTGTWTWGDESVAWELYAGAQIPIISDCTAAFCVAIQNGKIVLEREERGWGMIGGHVDDGETLEQALRRECLEEGGFTVNGPVLIGYRKIIATKPVGHQTPGRYYPFPISYIAYYFSVNDQPLAAPTEPETLEVRALTIEEIRQLNPPDYSVIKYGWDCYQNTL